MNWRTLTPLGWLASMLAVVVAIALIAGGWNKLWAFLPWSAESKLDRIEMKLELAEDARAARAIESIGQSEQIQRIETVHRQIVTVQAATANDITEARSAPDATDPLDTLRRLRLVGSDRMLCNYAPDLCQPAAADPSGAG